MTCLFWFLVYGWQESYWWAEVPATKAHKYLVLHESAHEKGSQILSRVLLIVPPKTLSFKEIVFVLNLLPNPHWYLDKKLFIKRVFIN